MKTYLTCLLVLLFTILTSCGPSRPSAGYEPASVSNCELPDTKWLKVVNGYDSKTVLTIATKFEAAAKADAKAIKKLGEGNASGSFKSDFSKIVNASSQEIVKVSQEFYEAYRSKRDALCSLLTLLNRPNISTNTRNEAESQFLEITKSFSIIKENRLYIS
jgi:hypothetical protein